MISATVLALVASSVPVDYEPHFLDPARYASPDGHFELAVDPGQRHGWGASQVALSRDGELVWRTELPFTFHQAAVDAQGRAFGFSETGPVGEGEFLVALVEPDGEVRVLEREPRSYGNIDGPELPWARGVLLPEGGRQALVWIGAERLGISPSSSWRCYDLASGERLANISPLADGEDGSSRGQYAYTVGCLRDLDLFLLHGWVSSRADDRPSEFPHGGHFFALFDWQGRMVWRLDRPFGTGVEDADGFESAVETQLCDGDGLLDIRPDGVFELWLAGEGQRVTFRAEQLDGETVVSELARATHAPNPVASAPSPESEALTLTALEPVSLERGEVGPLPATAKLAQWTIDAEGRIDLVHRLDGLRYERVVLRRDGTEASRREFEPVPGVRDDVKVTWHPLEGGGWFVHCKNGWNRPERSDTYLADDETGRLIPVDPQREPKYARVERGRDLRVEAADGRVLVGRDSLRRQFHNEPLQLLDRDGVELSRLLPHFPGGPRLRPQDYHFAPDGSLWTLDDFAFLRLDSTGEVVETLGFPDQGGGLHDSAGRAILGGDRIAMVDRYTGALHLWSADGQRLWIGPTAPGDVLRGFGSPDLTSLPDGSVVLESREGAHLFWSSSGERTRVVETGSHALFLDATGRRWTWRDAGGATLEDGDGAVLDRIERRADGRWIRGVLDLAVSDDGGLYLLEDYPWNFTIRERDTWFSRFDSQGRALWSVELPEVSRLSLELAVSGERVLLSSSFEEVALLVDPDNGRLTPITLEGRVPEDRWTLGLSADGERLLALDEDELTLRPFALP
ncbi:hypothetical protein [Engelhardtia mirabilis]|uniref:Uncharacterized protein n=1 Tax=Engelhardtia mirabilis TaxID=2528011 RepID=A0A518BGR7_9BACT|nr:hypothetical protein Pla133_11790 [Planctomycetes bacterium Pla133]QDV00440.1 hypothetical protein Pla86_11790 [Planctomycetes bacterium Pla86]